LSKKVLITGGGGFLGAHLAKALIAKGCQIDLLDNFSRGVKDGFLEKLINQSGVRLLEAELLSPTGIDELGDDYHWIIHLAAIIGVRHVLERPYAVLTDNVLMTSNVLRLARRQKNLERFLFASTSEVTAGTLQYMDLTIPTPEDSLLVLTDLAHPRTSYMLSKIYGEAMCQQADVPVTIIRPHNLYGPRMGMAHVVPELLKQAGELPPEGTLKVASVDHRRAFCYVDDGVEMITRLLEQGVDGTFNIGNQDAEVSIGDLAQIIINTVDRPLTITPLPPTPGSPVKRCPDMSKTIAAANYKPRVGLKEGVRLTYDWYQKTIFRGEEATAQ